MALRVSGTVSTDPNPVSSGRSQGSGRPPRSGQRPEQEENEQQEQRGHDDDRERRLRDPEDPHNSKKTPWLHGQVQLNPVPRKNDPKMVRVAPNMNSIVNRVMASFRSPGLVLGFRST